MQERHPPTISPEARAFAVAQASRARHERSEIRNQVRRSEISFFDAIVDPRPSIQKMRVIELLAAIPGVGLTRAKSIMARAEVSPARRIGGLGRHQIASLRKEQLLRKTNEKFGSLIVMSGPGGVGKSTIAAALRRESRFWVSVSATTRPPRLGESDGVDYFFLSEEEFTRQTVANEFLEWAEFAGARYGTPKAAVIRARQEGRDVLLEIDISGARQVRKSDPTAILVFISPPSWQELEDRLAGRGTDTPERRQARLDLARSEMAAASEFDHILINHRVEQVLAELVSLATSPNA
ncbi:MAG: guanylate kinase [Actinomycetes bacterium]